MKNLKTKLKNFGLGLGIAGLSFLPLKSLGQETQNSNKETTGFYYWGSGLSVHRFDNQALDEYFGAVFGIKGNIGLNSGKLSRIEFEAELASKKNKDEDMELSTLSAGAFYDLVLNPNNKILFYAGAGIKARSLMLQQNLGMNQADQVKTSGIGFGVRGGVEGKVAGNSVIYLELFYNSISGTLDNESTNLSDSGITLGVRGSF